MVTRILGKPAHVLLPLLLSAALLASAGRSRAANSDEPTPGSLRTFEDELLDAVRRGDRNALEGLLADEFELRSSHAKPLSKKEFIDRAVQRAHLLALVDETETEALVLGTSGLVSGWRKSLVRVIEDDGFVDRRLFVHLAERRDGRWRLLCAYELPDPG